MRGWAGLGAARRLAHGCILQACVPAALAVVLNMGGSQPSSPYVLYYRKAPSAARQWPCSCADCA